MEILGFINLPGWLLTIILTCAVIYLYGKRKHSLFKNLGIDGPKPGFFMGDLKKLATQGLGRTDLENIAKFGKCYGAFAGNMGALIVSDPNMVREICVKQFNKFSQRSQAISMAKFWRLAMSNATGDYWKFIRSTLSPTFSISKLRNMNPLSQTCMRSFGESMDKRLENSDIIEMQQAFGALTMDIICSVAFSIDVNSQQNPDNEFVKSAAKCMNVSAFSTIAILICVFFPEIKYILDPFDIDFIDKRASGYIRNATREAMKVRQSEANSAKYKDLLQLMLNAHNISDTDRDADDGMATLQEYKRRGLTEDEILSNAVFFLLAGYDTSATTLTWCAYCLALNPHCQDKLVAEIDKEIGTEMASYDNVLKLEYLDGVISEALRLYPPASRTNRECVEETTVCGVRIPKGMSVNLAIFAMHRLEEFWPNPELYEPERFSLANKDKIIPFSYIPFGVGPRNCVGMRLALMNIKMALVTFFQRYRLEKLETTVYPPVFSNGMFLKPKGGMPLRVKRR